MEIHAILVSVKKNNDQYLLTLLLFSSALEVFCNSDFYEKNSSLLEVHNEAIFTLESKKEKFKSKLFVSDVSTLSGQRGM